MDLIKKKQVEYYPMDRGFFFFWFDIKIDCEVLLYQEKITCLPELLVIDPQCET